MTNVGNGGRVDCLDGLRGLAALWVLVGHAHILTGFSLPVIGDPDLGVDLFIMIGTRPWERRAAGKHDQHRDDDAATASYRNAHLDPT